MRCCDAVGAWAFPEYLDDGINIIFMCVCVCVCVCTHTHTCIYRYLGDGIFERLQAGTRENDSNLFATLALISSDVARENGKRACEPCCAASEASA